MSSRLKIHKIDIELGESVPGYVFGHLQKSLSLFPKNCLEMGFIQLLLLFSMSSCDKNIFQGRFFIAFVSITLRPFIFTGQLFTSLIRLKNLVEQYS